MSVTAQCQTHALRHARRDIRLMREKNNGCVVSHFCQCSVEIVDTQAASRWSQTPRRDKSNLVAKAREPERAATRLDPRYIVLVNRDAHSFEGAAAIGHALASKLHLLVV